MYKRISRVLFICIFIIIMTGCGSAGADSTTVENETEIAVETTDPVQKYNATEILLSDSGIKVGGSAIGTDESDAVYKANDIVFYLEGQGVTYGEGTEKDEHSQSEADAHTVVHITKPGNYILTGSLSKGQIAVDLGEDADEDPEAVVTLILNNVDITCEVAPAVIFFNVYECGSNDEEDATRIVDTTAAGANVIIMDGTENNVTGSHVARIYKSVELSEDGTEVIDSKKLHKYDAAFYSKMSMNINGENNNTGILNINADNEGLGTELHLTMNGGTINISSGNDGINTNEDGVSVTTINGGNLNIMVNGATGEGDGIDSNGWLVINGGNVNAAACSFSMDAGIDSDMGIHINGGDVVATGNMLDAIADSEQNYVVFSFASAQIGGSRISMQNEDGVTVGEWTRENDYTMLVFSSGELTDGIYSLWRDGEQLSVLQSEVMMGGHGPGMSDGRMEHPEGNEFPMDGERPQIPDGEHHFEKADGEIPEEEFPRGARRPVEPGNEERLEGGMPLPEEEFPNMPSDGMHSGEMWEGSGESVMEFTIVDGGNLYMVL